MGGFGMLHPVAYRLFLGTCGQGFEIQGISESKGRGSWLTTSALLDV